MIWLLLLLLSLLYCSNGAIQEGKIQEDLAWPVLGRNPRHLSSAQESLISTPSKRSLVPKWSFATAAPVQGSASIATDGTIFIGSDDNHLYSLSPQGELLWKYKLGDSKAWIWATPAIAENGNIYVGGFDSAFYAFSKNGTLLWKQQLLDSISSSAVIGRDGTIYVGGWSGELYAFSPEGKILWTFYAIDPIRASPALVYTDASKGKGGKEEGKILFGNIRGSFFGLSLEGKLLFEKKFYNGFFYATPAIADDGTIVVGTYGSRELLGLSPETGFQVWNFRTRNDVQSSAAISLDGSIYFGSKDGNFYCLASNGEEKWRLSLGESVDSSPSITQEGTILVGTSTGSFFKIDPQGTILERFEIAAAIFGNPAISLDGSVIIGAANGRVYSF